MTETARHHEVPGRFAAGVLGVELEHSYARELEGTYAAQEPRPVADPSLVALNVDLAAELGLDVDVLGSEVGVSVLSGNRLPADATPIAQAYAGHQFGSLNPQLGDGRAVLLGEIVTSRAQIQNLLGVVIPPVIHHGPRPYYQRQ